MADDTLVGSLFPDEVLSAEAIPEVRRADLYDEEWNCVARAVPKRQAEFCAVRICARRLLARLGFFDYPLLPNKDRSPRWPEGIIGSISHTNGYCAVVAAKAGALVGLGLDVEQDSPLKPELIRLICTERERNWLDNQPESDRCRLAKLIFCAKESAYKCQYPLSKAFVDFKQAELYLDLETRKFRAIILKDLGERLSPCLSISGRYDWRRSLVIASAFLRKEEIAKS
ncbi:MAG: 4'-phosphopantetheinyl transferase superfamily protein [Deltaproteobacteria bacterium]|nr:4'-phosphopantetheinyl transferase superfamily protein [Deltaproteobacteria bacterium]